MATVLRSNSSSGRRVTIATARDDSDLPPDSVVIPITQEIIWQDLNMDYDSEDSTTACTNPKSHPNTLPWLKTETSSNRVAAMNLNATTSSPIVCIRSKIQRHGFINCRRPPSIFPRGRRNGSKKSSLADSEPGSPKVSCLGHVLSEREREKRKRQREASKGMQNKEQYNSCCAISLILNCVGDRKRRESTTEAAEAQPASPEKAESSTVGAAEIQRSAIEETQQPEIKEKEVNQYTSDKVRRSPEKAETVVGPPPSISAIKKFSSGRRSASWGDDVAAAQIEQDNNS